jgi:hypothetical protein
MELPFYAVKSHNSADLKSKWIKEINPFVNSSEILGGQKSNAGSVSPRFYIIPLLSPFPPWVNIHLPLYNIPDQAAHPPRNALLHLYTNM